MAAKARSNRLPLPVAGSYCVMVLLSVVDRTSAFVGNVNAPNAFVRRSGAGPASAMASLGGAGRRSVTPSVMRPRSASRRTHQLGMEVVDNPITSKVFGKPDAKGKSSKTPDMNEEITESGVDTVRCVISIKGMDEQLGIMSTEEAIDRAQNEGLDLVMISADAEPPVVKIIDYGKFKYKQDRRKKDNKAKHKATEMKEVKMSYKIETHDYGVRMKNAKKFVTQGHRVRVVVQFRGREQSHIDLGYVLLDKVSKDLEGLALMEPKRREGNRLSMIVFPKPTT